MLLLPLLHRLTDLREHEAFACSVCTMLPLSVVSLVVYWLRGGEFLTAALPYLAGGALGGIAAGLLLRRLSAVWLHRALGALEKAGRIRRVSGELAFDAAAYEALEQAAVALLRGQGGATAAELRDAMGTTRKYAIPLLEHFDAQGVTRRDGDLRVLGPKRA